MCNTSWGLQIVLCDSLMCDTDKFVSSDRHDITTLVDWM